MTHFVYSSAQSHVSEGKAAVMTTIHMIQI